MTVVAGVLLDRVDEDPPQRDPASPNVLALDVEMWRLGDEPLGEGHFLPPCLPGSCDDTGSIARAVEIPAGVGRGGEQGCRVPVGQHAPEPAALHIGEMPDEPERRQRP